MISIIIPTFNEAEMIESTLKHVLSQNPGVEYEIIVADGGSSDETVNIASKHSKVVSSRKGRGLQLNEGAKNALGDVLLFLHADVILPKGALDEISEKVGQGYQAGAFAYKWTRQAGKIAFIKRIFYLGFVDLDQSKNLAFGGDECLFCVKEVFDEVGGFKDIPIMEDFEISKRLRESYKVVRIMDPTVKRSSRRAEKSGFIKSRLQWMIIPRLFWLGVPARWLVKFYPDVR